MSRHSRAVGRGGAVIEHQVASCELNQNGSVAAQGNEITLRGNRDGFGLCILTHQLVVEGYIANGQTIAFVEEDAAVSRAGGDGSDGNIQSIGTGANRARRIEHQAIGNHIAVGITAIKDGSDKASQCHGTTGANTTQGDVLCGK